MAILVMLHLTGCAIVDNRGGVVSALLYFLLDGNFIDGAIVATWSRKEERAVACYINCKEEIAACGGSWYSQTSPIEELQKHQNERVAIVTLGCQTQTIIKGINSCLIKRPELIIGLVCEGQYSLDLTKTIIKKYARGEKINRFRPRDKQFSGWPGEILIQTDSKKISVGSDKRRQLNNYYIHYRCMQCYDMNNIYADIVCGDPYFMEGRYDKNDIHKGKSIVISRTENGEKAIRDAQNKGYIILDEINGNEFLTQTSHIDFSYAP